VYINPDLAPEAARLAYEQRQNRRVARQRRDVPPIGTDCSRSKQVDQSRSPTASASTTRRVHAPPNTLHATNSSHPSASQQVDDLPNENQSAVDVMSSQLSDFEILTDDSSSVNPCMSENIHLRYTVPVSINPVAPARPATAAAEVEQATTITIMAEVHHAQDSDVQNFQPSPALDHASTAASMAADKSR